MPKIPEYLSKEPVRVASPKQLPLNLYALPTLEMERAGLEVAQIGQDLKEAHRTGVYSQNISESASYLQDLALEFEQDPDIWTIEERAKKAVEDFKNKRLKELRDPVVAKNFAFAYDKLAMTKLAGITGSARKRQANLNKAQTMGSLDALEGAVHKASSTAEAAQLMAQMKGILTHWADASGDYAAAQREWKKRISRMAGGEVREDIWENPREAHEALVKDKYEGLEAAERIKYIEMAERRIEAEDRDALRAIKEMERIEAKELKERQEQTGITMLQMMADGTLTRKWIDEQVVKRNLDEGSVAAGLRFLEDGGGTVDDKPTVNRLTDKILAGEDAGTEISNAFAGGKLRFDTQLQMKTANARRQRQEEQTEEGRALLTLFEQLDIPTGELAPLAAEESARKAQARELFYIYRDQNIEPWTAKRMVLDRIEPVIDLKLLSLPVPLWGGNGIRNSEDLAGATTWLMEQINAGMPRSEIIYWHEILTKYQKIDEQFGIENLLTEKANREKSRDQAIEKGLRERGQKVKTTRELR